MASLYVVRATDRDHAEKRPYEQIAKAAIAKQRRIKKGEDNTCNADPDKPPSTISQEKEADGTSETDRHDNAHTHSLRRDPSLGTGPFGPQAVFTVCAFQVVIQIVDKISRHLHHQGKGHTQHRRPQPERAFGGSQGRRRDYGNERGGQRLRAGCQEPRSGRVSTDNHHSEKFITPGTPPVELQR